MPLKPASTLSKPSGSDDHVSFDPGKHSLEILQFPQEKGDSIWQTKAASLLDAKSVFVSTGVVPLRNGELGFNEGLLVRDPDGHVMQLIES